MHREALAPEIPRPRVIVQGQLRRLTSTARGCFLTQAETPTADLELVESIHRRLPGADPASLFTLRNTSGRPLQAKQLQVDQLGTSTGI